MATNPETDFLTIDTLDSRGRSFTMHESTQPAIFDRPLVVYLGLGTTATSTLGRMYLGEHRALSSRRVLSLAPKNQQWCSFADRAASDAEILARYDAPIDILGMSSGGLLASYVAAELGDQVKHLVTVSAVGTHRHTRQYITGLPSQMYDGVHETIRMARSGQSIKSVGAKAIGLARWSEFQEYVWTVRQTLSSRLSDSVERLSAETGWVDVLGSRDAMTDWHDHLLLHEHRRRKCGKSALRVEHLQGHMWASRARDIAWLAESLVYTS